MANEYGHAPESEKKMMSHFQSILDDYIDAENTETTPRKENPHKAPYHTNQPDRMTYTKMLEAMDDIAENMENPAPEDEDTNEDLMDTPIEADSDSSSIEDDPDLLDKVDKMFTPVLISQGFEKDIAEVKNAEIAEATILTEKNMIAFDDETRMSQLISVCALLIAQKKNTSAWQMFKKAAAIKKQSKIQIQKEEYDDAKTLAQKYLIKVSTTNNSSVARQAANDLLPQTQH